MNPLDKMIPLDIRVVLLSFLYSRILLRNFYNQQLHRCHHLDNPEFFQEDRLACLQVWDKNDIVDRAHMSHFQYCTHPNRTILRPHHLCTAAPFVIPALVDSLNKTFLPIENTFHPDTFVSYFYLRKNDRLDIPRRLWILCFLDINRTRMVFEWFGQWQGSNDQLHTRGIRHRQVLSRNLRRKEGVTDIKF